MYKLFLNYYSKLPDMCGEAPRLSRAKPNVDAWRKESVTTNDSAIESFYY